MRFTQRDIYSSFFLLFARSDLSFFNRLLPSMSSFCSPVCPASQIVNNTPHLCAAVVSFTAFTAHDNCAVVRSGLQSNAQYGNNSLFPVGTEVVIYGAEDAAVNNATCNFSVTVRDVESPVIVCPANVTRGTDPGLCAANISYLAPNASDNCAVGQPHLLRGNASMSLFHVGEVEIIYSVSDAAGNSAQCGFYVAVHDTEAPRISCPQNILTTTSTGSCSRVVNYQSPNSTDNCGVISMNVTLAAHESGSAFPKGQTIINWTAADAAGDASWCMFDIVVLDKEPPTVSCPAPIIVNASYNMCSANVTFGSFSYSDNCAIAFAGLSSSNLYSNNSVFQVGKRNVSYLAQDTSGNNASCSFAVVVQDAQAPVLSCPTNLTVSTTTGICLAKALTYTQPSSSDNCNGVSVNQTGGFASGSNFSLGLTLNEYLAVDTSGNTASCTFAVHVIDTEAPVIRCPASLQLSAATGLCGRNVTYGQPLATDNCAVSTIRMINGLASGAFFPVGTTNITYVVNDTSGLTASCTFQVVVVDDQTPIIIGCPAAISKNADYGLCSAVVNYNVPNMTDNCAANGLKTNRTGPNSGSRVNVGTNLVVYTVTDSSGNTANCSFNITVIDTQKPNITCPSNSTQSASAAVCSATVVYASPTWTDNCGGSTLVGPVVGQVSGAAFDVGTTMVEFSAVDGSGNRASCSFYVIVVDITPPVIHGCPASQIVGTDPGQCSHNLSYTPPTATDNCYSNITLVSGLGPYGIFPESHITEVVYKAVDEVGHATFCNFSVTVRNTEPPTISCPSGILTSTDLGVCNARVNFTAPIGSGNCPGATTALITGLAPLQSFPLGITAETYLVTSFDTYIAVTGGFQLASLSSECSFNVTVVDREAPTISCPANIVHDTNTGVCFADLSFIVPVGQDNCPGASTSGPNSPSNFSLGLTTLVYTVTDAHGHQASCETNVTIVDQEAPRIVCPALGTLVTPQGSCSVNFIFAAPSVTDNCESAGSGFPNNLVGLGNGQWNATYGGGIGAVQLSGPRNESSLAIGNWTVSFLASDSSGNTAGCHATASVIDDYQPKISCPAAITINTSLNECGAIVAFAAPVGQQNCSVPSTVQKAGLTTGSFFPSGATQEIFEVTDYLGRHTSCNFTVTVVDAQRPRITCPSNIVVGTATGTCAAIVTYGVANTSDNCPLQLAVSHNGTSSGSVFGLGSSVVTYSAQDGQGLMLSSSCSFYITVVDQEPPILACPANITASSAVGYCGANVSYSVSATDNCHVYNVSIVQGLSSGSFFAVGSTVVEYRAFDTAGNEARCRFTVTVRDEQAPQLTCPSNVSTTTLAGVCGRSVAYSSPTSSDNCGIASVALVGGNASGSLFGLGTTIVTYMATDVNGNSKNCSFEVTVTDHILPKITCPASLTVSTAANQCNATVTYGSVSAVDGSNCPGVTETLFGPSSGSSFPLGTTQLYYSISAPGGPGICSFSITVRDTQAPTLNYCPSSVSTTTSPGVCSRIVTYTQPTGWDNCNQTTSRISGLSSGSAFNTGTTNVTYVSVDESGNQAVCSFDIEVLDKEAPRLQCPNNIQLDNTKGFCAANNVSYAAVRAADNCGNFSVVVRQILGLASGSNFSVGTTIVAFLGTDASRNNATCEFSVNVSDVEPPTITCPGNALVGTDKGVCRALVNYSRPVGVDNCNGAVTQLVQGPGAAGNGSGWNMFGIGLTQVNYSVTDTAHLTASCGFVVQVNDTEAPVISCGNTIVLSADAGLCSAVVTFAEATATDNCGVASLQQIHGPNNGSRVAVGTYVVEFSAADAAGNTAVCSFNVSVVDTQPPAVSCMASVTVGTPSDLCGANISLTAPAVSDNCGVVQVVQTQGLSLASAAVGPNSSSLLQLAEQQKDVWVMLGVGSSIYEFAVWDAAGHNVSCGFTVTVRDLTVPIISCPGNITLVRTDIPTCGSTANVSVPLGRDNCNSTTRQVSGVAVNVTLPSGVQEVFSSYSSLGGAGAELLNGSGAFLVGTTAQVYEVVDASGNRASCTQVVTIVDRTRPTIVCPVVTGPLSGGAFASQPGVCGATVTYGAPVTHDNCNVSSVGSLTAIGSGNVFPVGSTLEVYEVFDVYGNNASCSFDVVVRDVQAPNISCGSSVVVSTDAGRCDAVIRYAGPMASDNCAGYVVNQTSGPQFQLGLNGSGNTVAVGEISLGFRVTDDAGLEANCEWNVTVVDREAPYVACPPSVVISTEPGTCSAAVVFGSLTATDNCGVANVTVQPASAINGSRFGRGVTPVTYTVVDVHGLNNTCTFTVSVVDKEPPVVTCPNPISLAADAGLCGAVVNYSVDSSDNCGPTTKTLLKGLNSSSLFGVGLTTVETLISDSSGNNVTCSFFVTVADKQAPSIVCPGNVTHGTDAGLCSAVVTYSSIGVSDNCPGASATIDKGLISGAVFAIGATLVTYVARDASNNTGNCSFYVDVKDTEAPKISEKNWEQGLFGINIINSLKGFPFDLFISFQLFILYIYIYILYAPYI